MADDDDFSEVLRLLKKKGIELPSSTTPKTFAHDLGVVLQQIAFMKGDGVSDMGPSLQFSIDDDKFNDTIRRLREGGFELPENLTWEQFARALKAAIGRTPTGDDGDDVQFSAEGEMSEADAKSFVDSCERYKKNPGAIACPY